MALVEDGEDIALLSELFFVVDAPVDRYLIVQRETEYAARVVAEFYDFDYAHFCAKQLTKYAAETRKEPAK